MRSATGWAVYENDEINVRSISPTRVGAQVNWLCTERQLLIHRGVTETAIEEMWHSNKGAAKIGRVRIEPLTEEITLTRR